VTVVYPSRRNLPARVRAVTEFLSEIIQADPAMRDDGDVRAASHTEVDGSRLIKTLLDKHLTAPAHINRNKHYENDGSSGVLASHLGCRHLFSASRKQNGDDNAKENSHHGRCSANCCIDRASGGCL